MSNRLIKLALTVAEKLIEKVYFYDLTMAEWAEWYINQCTHHQCEIKNLSKNQNNSFEFLCGNRYFSFWTEVHLNQEIKIEHWTSFACIAFIRIVCITKNIRSWNQWLKSNDFLFTKFLYYFVKVKKIFNAHFLLT